MDLLLELTPPPGGDVDRGRAVYGLYWSIVVVGTVFTSLRFWARIKIRALGWDDWIMAFTMLQLLALTITGTIMAASGGCRHLYYLVMDPGPQQIVVVTRLFYICQPFAIMGIATGRVAVAVLVLRIMGTSYWRKRFLWFIIGSTILISALNSILLFAACTPAEGVWNPFITANCWNPVIMTDVTIFSSSWNVFIDVCLALIPVTLFWNLNLSLKKRVALCFLMSGGILAAIFGAIKTSLLPETNDLDVTWAYFDLLMWNGAETILVIVCGSIPTLKPLYDMYIRRRTTSHGTSYPSWPSKHNSNKRSFPSNSTGDETYVRLEPVQKDSKMDPSVIKVAHRVDVDVDSDHGSYDAAAINKANRAPWDQAASDENLIVEGQQSRTRAFSPTRDDNHGHSMV